MRPLPVLEQLQTLNALVRLFQSEDNMGFDGLVKRSAVCVNSEDGRNLSNSQFTWYSAGLTPAQFCSLMQGPFPFSNVNCQTTAAVIQLSERCDVPATTTVSPNVTTIQANSSTPNTTAESLNATTTPVNVTGNGTTPALSKEGQADALLALTRDASKLNATQISLLISALEKLLEGPNVSLPLGNTSVQIMGNLQDASIEAVAQSAFRMRRISDIVALKLVLIDACETLKSSSLTVAAKEADGVTFEETSFTIADPNNICGSRTGRHVRDSSIPQASVTLPSTLTQNLTSEEQLLVSRVQFNFYQKNTTFQDASLGSRRMNSGVVSASVSNLSIAGLQDEVIIRLRNIEPIPDNYESLCVFWDDRLNNGSGGWNQNGCRVRNVTDNETVCGCNHLTSFSILLVSGRATSIKPLVATILTFITYIGCGISAIFLAVTLLTYLSFGKLRKDIPSKILIQLCLSLLLLNLVFLVDAWLALYADAVGLCISTAWFLHYFLLVVFTWMGLEAVHMYLALVKVFNTYVSHYMIRFSVVGWGVPMLVVIIVIAIDKDNYGLVSYGRFDGGTSDDFCWIKNDIAFYVAVVAYFCAVFVFNFIMFLVVLVQLCRLKRQNPHNLQHRTTLQDVRSVTGITVLLGLTWGFAFFAWEPVNLPFMYLFAIFNSLQGFFIFVFHCLVKESVRRQWRTYLCCGKMRLAENSEWSRTATQKTARRSSVTRGTSLPSSKMSQFNNSSSSSSFLVNDNDSNGGIGNPVDDTAITAGEDHPADVIFNEANSQYRTQPTS
ncbi:adhesion G-protein coupled receptor G2 [Neosynchiropus ocellatus]